MWRLAICSLLRVCTRTSLHFAGQNGNSCIKMKFEAWRSITTDQFILCMVFCEEIKWINAPVLIYDRTYFWQQTIRTISLISLLWQRLLVAYGFHLQRVLWNLAQHCKSRLAVSQSDWHKVGSVDGRSTNRRSRNLRSKMYGKTKHSWSTINSEQQVDRRSVNRRSNLIWLVMEKPDLG